MYRHPGLFFLPAHFQKMPAMYFLRDVLAILGWQTYPQGVRVMVKLRRAEKTEHALG